MQKNYIIFVEHEKKTFSETPLKYFARKIKEKSPLNMQSVMFQFVVCAALVRGKKPLADDCCAHAHYNPNATLINNIFSIDIHHRFITFRGK